MKKFKLKGFGGKGKLKMRVRAKSPEILMFVGVAGVIGATIGACKATRKLDAILDEHNNEIDKIKNYVADLDDDRTDGEGNHYSEKDERHDVFVTWRDTCVSVVKLYAIPVTVGILSIGCIFQSHRILRSRLMTMTTAYNATEKAFSEYRKRVAEKVGADEEKRIRYNAKREQVEETDENGKKKKRIVDIVDRDVAQYSPYARWFEEGASPRWERSPEYNKLFLVSQQEIANNILRAQGYLFLNDVYELLGFDKTEAGQTVGWIYDEENPVGDNFVDFGLYDLYSRRSHDFVNGIEPSILLDFNVDGDIVARAFANRV